MTQAAFRAAFHDARAVQAQDEVPPAAKAAVWSSFLRETADYHPQSPEELEWRLAAGKQQTYWRAQAAAQVTIEQPQPSTDLVLYSSNRSRTQEKAIEEATAFNDRGNEYRPYDAARDRPWLGNVHGVVSSAVGSYGGIPYSSIGLGLVFGATGFSYPIGAGYGNSYYSGYPYGYSGFNSTAFRGYYPYSPYSVYSPSGYGLGGYGSGFGGYGYPF